MKIKLGQIKEWPKKRKEMKKKKEMKKVSQEFMENVKAVGRISGYYSFIENNKFSGKNDDWIKYVCSCYQPSHEDTLIPLMDLDDQYC